MIICIPLDGTNYELYWCNDMNVFGIGVPMICTLIFVHISWGQILEMSLETWVLPKIMIPPNHPFVHRVFHYFHHPFWGTTIFGSTPTSSPVWQFTPEGPGGVSEDELTRFFLGSWFSRLVSLWFLQKHATYVYHSNDVKDLNVHLQSTSFRSWGYHKASFLGGVAPSTFQGGE